MSSIPKEMRMPLFQASEVALKRIKDVTLKGNSPESRQACRAQVERIDSQESWNLMHPVYRAFYELSACVEITQFRACLLKLAGAVMATTAAMDGKDEIGPVWELFGLAKGDPALELAQFKETASALMQVVQDSLADTEKKLRATQEELESAQRANKEMEALVELTQTRAAETVTKLEARVNELNHQESAQTRKIQEQASVIEKLRAELQTAQAKVATPPKQDTASPELSAELARLKALVAEQAAKITEQGIRIDRYSNMVDSCFDDDMKRCVIFIAENQHKVGKPGSDPLLSMHIDHAIYVLRHSLDNRSK